jgi:hypothetical protein
VQVEPWLVSIVHFEVSYVWFYVVFTSPKHTFDSSILFFNKYLTSLWTSVFLFLTKPGLNEYILN